MICMLNDGEEDANKKNVHLLIYCYQNALQIFRWTELV